MSGSTVEQIKARLGILDVVQTYIRLEKAGASYKARCPFHTEKTPSFFVSPGRESWHCFGCGKGGDMFSFVQEADGVEFIEALRLLADRAGVEMKKEDPRMRTERMRLLCLLDDATAFFQHQLAGMPEVGAYISERGLSASTVADFRIGYAPRTWDSLLRHLLLKGYREDEAVKAGLALPSQRQGTKSRYYDRFRGRVMFPLADGAGRIVGFSGRIFAPPGQEPATAAAEQGGKYINTPQTLLYDKSAVLYGFDRAKTAIRAANACVLVEGQMDVVLSHQAGVPNTVAVSGTALTVQHVRQIRRLADTLLMAFDRDAAGSSATRRSVEEALAEQFDVRVVTLPSGADPADIVKADPETWKTAVGASVPFLEFFIQELEEQASGKEVHRLWRDATSTLLPFVARMPGAVDRAFWIGAVAKRFGMREEALWEELRPHMAALRQGVRAAPQTPPRAEGQRTRRQLLEERLLGIGCWKGAPLLSALREDAIGALASAAFYDFFCNIKLCISDVIR